MLLAELNELISQGEGAKLEFKRDSASSEVMAKEIVAFANMNGGKILIGVEDDGSISGVKKKNLQEWLMDTVIGHHVHPHILPDFDVVKTDDNKQVAIVTIPQGVAKPYGVKSKGRHDTYLRYGNICKLATREQLARLFDSSGLVYADKMPAHGSGLRDLDMKRLRNYFVDITGVLSLEEWEELGEEQLVEWLVKRDLMKAAEGDKQPENCTIAGLLLFGRNPAQGMPQSSIRLTIFREKDKDHDTILDDDIRSPFVGINPNFEDSSYAEPSVPKKIIAQLQGHISREEIQGVNRVRLWDYPEEVIRELVVNAFAHRDWTKQTDIEIHVYSDRMEIKSPGALPNGMTIEKIEAGQKTTRNNNIVNILREYGLMEHQGMGIRRKVIPIMKQENKEPPKFEATEDYFKVTLWKSVKIWNNSVKREFDIFVGELQELTEVVELVERGKELSKLEQKGLIRSFELIYLHARAFLECYLDKRRSVRGGHIFKIAVEQGFIEDMRVWIIMSDVYFQIPSARYDKKTAPHLCEMIVKQFHPAFVQLKTRLTELHEQSDK